MSENILNRIDPREVMDVYQDATLEEKDKVLGILLLLPSLLLILTVILYPLIYNIHLSFHTVPLQGQPNWTELGNYKWLFNNNAFWASLQRTIAFAFLSSMLATVGGLAATLLLRRQFLGRRIIRSFMLLPFVVPIVAVAYSWRWMFNTVYGIIPYWLGQLGFVELSQMSLLSASGTALWTLSLYEGWRYFPFAFLLIFARAQAIPQDVYEAAKIDGASRWAQFKDITFPELKFIIATVFLLRFIWNFNRFTDVWLVTHEFEVLSVFTYQTAFVTFKLGYAAAISVVLFLFLVILVSVYVVIFMREK